MPGFRLFAPVRAFEVVPYEPPWSDTGEDLRELSADEVMHCAPVILPEIRDYLRNSDYFFRKSRMTCRTASCSPFPNLLC